MSMYMYVHRDTVLTYLWQLYKTNINLPTIGTGTCTCISHTMCVYVTSRLSLYEDSVQVPSNFIYTLELR